MIIRGPIRLVPNTPHNMLTEKCWKWHWVSCCGFSCAKEYIFRVGKCIPSKGSLICDQEVGRNLWPHLQPFTNCTWLVYLQVKGVVPFGGDSNRNHNGAWFFIPVFVLQQSYRKFFECLHLGFIALLPEHQFLHAVVLHILRLLMGRNQPPSEFCVWFQVFHNVGDGGIPQQQPYNSHCINRMQTWCLRIFYL